MSNKKKTAGSGNSTAAKKKTSNSIIAEPIDIVNILTNNINLCYEDIKNYTASELGATKLFCCLFRPYVKCVYLNNTVSRFEISLDGVTWMHEEYNGRLTVEALLIWFVAKVQTLIPSPPQLPRREWTDEMKKLEKTDSVYRKYYRSLNGPVNRSRLIRTLKIFVKEDSL